MHASDLHFFEVKVVIDRCNYSDANDVAMLGCVMCDTGCSRSVISLAKLSSRLGIAESDIDKTQRIRSQFRFGDGVVKKSSHFVDVLIFKLYKVRFHIIEDDLEAKPPVISDLEGLISLPDLQLMKAKLELDPKLMRYTVAAEPEPKTGPLLNLNNNLYIRFDKGDVELVKSESAHIVSSDIELGTLSFAGASFKKRTDSYCRKYQRKFFVLNAEMNPMDASYLEVGSRLFGLEQSSMNGIVSKGYHKTRWLEVHGHVDDGVSMCFMNMTQQMVLRNVPLVHRTSSTRWIDLQQLVRLGVDHSMFNLIVVNYTPSIHFTNVLTIKPSELDNRKIEKARNLHHQCGDEGCWICDLTKRTFRKSGREFERPTRKNQKVSCDVVGPVTPSFSNLKWSLNFVDNWDGSCLSFAMRTRKEVSKGLRKWCRLYGSPEVMRTDKAQEYVGDNSDFARTAVELGIKLEQSPGYLHWYNGKIERLNRSLTEKCRVALVISGLDARFWPAALAYSAVVQTNLKTGEFDGMLKVFGCKVLYVLCMEQRAKGERFESISRPGVFVGINRESREYLIYTPDGKLAASKNVRFHEYSVFQRGETHECREFGKLEHLYTSDASCAHAVCDEIEKQLDERGDQGLKDFIALHETDPVAHPKFEFDYVDASADTDDESDADDELNMTTVHTAEDSNGFIRANKIVTLVDSNRVLIPFHVDSDAKEYSGWGKGQTLVECADANGQFDPSGKSIVPVMTIRSLKPVELDSELPNLADIRSRVSKLRHMPDSQFSDLCSLIPSNAKFKTRTVVLGCVESLPGYMRAAPTLLAESSRLLCAFAASTKKMLKKFDIPTAFLKSFALDREVFIGPVPEGIRLACGLKTHYGRARTAVYGFQDASLRFYQTLAQAFVDMGMPASSADKCLFIFRDGESVNGAGAHVDDVLCAVDEDFWVQHLKPLICDRFGVTEVGCAYGSSFTFTGVEIAQAEDFSVTMSMARFVEGMTRIATKRVKTDEPLEKSDVLYIQKLVCGVNWVAVRAAPHLSYSCGNILSRLKGGKMDLVKEAIELYNLCIDTAHYKLFYRCQNYNCLLTMCDANHHLIVREDEEDPLSFCRNTGGHIHFLCDLELVKSKV